MQVIITAVVATLAALLIFIFIFPHLWMAVVFFLKLALLASLVTAVVAAYISREELRKNVDAGRYDKFLVVLCAVGAVGSLLAFLVALFNDDEIVFPAAAFLPYGLLLVYFGTRTQLQAKSQTTSQTNLQTELRTESPAAGPNEWSPITSPVSVPNAWSPNTSPVSVPIEWSPNTCQAVTERLIEKINLALPPEGWVDGFTVADLLDDKLKMEIFDTLARHQNDPQWASSAHVFTPPDESLRGLSPSERFLAHFCDGTDFKNFLARYRKISIPDDIRFRHQFIVGAAGAGKTALLSAQIYDDLFKVAEGKCSLFIMDSQNELFPALARNSVFTAGRPLHGKLVYVDPSSAISQAPNASLAIPQGVLSEKGKALIEQHLRNLETSELSRRLHDAVTRSALRNRIDAMLANQHVRAMFSQPRNRLDLFNELREPKVILVNTNKALLKNATGPYGRIFLARLLEDEEQRMVGPNAQRLPVFCYINGAGDYLSEDANVEAFLDKAWKQNVSLTFAVERTEHITSPAILAALEGCAVQAWAEGPSDWNFSLDGIGTARVDLPEIDFSKGELISDAEFEKLKLDMWNKYGGLPVERPKSAGSARAAE